MRINLIFDQQSQPLSNDLISFLNRFFRTDLVQFQRVEQVICEKNIPISWEEIFQTLLLVRSGHPESEKDYFVYVMSGENENRWFAAQDFIDSKLAFVQSGNWDDYEGIDSFSGTAYHLLAILFRMVFYGNLVESSNTYHQKSKGCLNDFVGNKSQVVHKIRSSYICPACIEKVKESGKLNTESFEFFNGAVNAISEVRNRLIKVDLGTIVILREFNLVEGKENELAILIGEKKVSLNISKGWNSALYLYLLENEKGMYAKVLLADQKALSRLAELYAKVKPTQTVENAFEVLNQKIKYKIFQDFIDQTVCAVRRTLKISLKNFPELLDQLTISTVGDLRLVKLDRSKVLSRHLDAA